MPAPRAESCGKFLRDMGKREILEEVLRRLRREVETLTRAAAEAAGEATHAESKQENKYDTRGLEASYLAHGQARRAAEVQQAIEQLKAFAPPAYAPEQPIRVGALIAADKDGEPCRFFLLPYVGGMQVRDPKGELQVLSTDSPLGRELLGKRAGDEFTFHRKDYAILSVE
jgi:transcription elongation GreA/GreB family factor